MFSWQIAGLVTYLSLLLLFGLVYFYICTLYQLESNWSCLRAPWLGGWVNGWVDKEVGREREVFLPCVP